jgi:hypothetical protein
MSEPRLGPPSATSRLRTAYALAVFGEIDELEVVREGTDQCFGLAVGQSPHQRVELGTSSSVASAQVLREGAGGLGLGKRALTARLAEDFAKEPGQEINIV